MIVVERARVLRQRINLTAQRTPCAAIDGMGVRGADDVGAGVVDGGVDHECSGVEEAVGAAVYYFAVVVD